MRVVTFADGFTSSSPPVVEGAGQQNSLLLNNSTNTTLLTITDDYRSVFIDYEITRKDSVSSFAETGRLTMFYKDNLWDFSIGLTQGSEMTDSTTSERVVFSIQNITNGANLRYTTGNMGSSYVGEIRMIISKVRSL